MALVALPGSPLGLQGPVAPMALASWPLSPWGHQCHVSVLASGAKAYCNIRVGTARAGVARPPLFTFPDL
jgi:hypothetical protein